MTPQNDVPGSVPTVSTVAAAPAMGFVSSEFAVTIVTVLGMAVKAVPQQYVPLVAALAGVYVAARTLLKIVHVLGYAKSLPDLPALPSGTTVTATTITQVPKGQ